MSNVVVGTFGKLVTLWLRQGMELGPFNVLLKSNGVAVDMTGSTVRGHIRESISAAAFTPFDITLVNTSTVSFTFGLDKDASDLLIRTAAPIESAYVWDIEWLDSSGKPRPVFYGDMRVRKRVTRV